MKFVPKQVTGYDFGPWVRAERHDLRTPDAVLRCPDPLERTRALVRGRQARRYLGHRRLPGDHGGGQTGARG